MNRLLTFVVAFMPFVLTTVFADAQKPDTVINGIGFKSYGVEIDEPGNRITIDIMLPVPNGNKVLRAICDSIVGPNYNYEHFQEEMNAAYLHEHSESEIIDDEPEAAEADESYDDGFDDFDYERMTQIYPMNVYDDFIIYSFYEMEYTGGIHPFWGIVCSVFDLSTGKILDESDIFECTNTNLASIGWELCKKLGSYLEEAPDYSMCRSMLNGNFYFDKKGLTYMYVPYEVTYYAAGEPELTLSKKFLKPYLKKDGPLYKFWYGKNRK